MQMGGIKMEYRKFNNTIIARNNCNSMEPVIGISYILAKNSADIISVMQLPSILMVAPRGKENEYIFSDIPIFLHCFIDVGRAALLDCNVNADIMAG